VSSVDYDFLEIHTGRGFILVAAGGQVTLVDLTRF